MKYAIWNNKGGTGKTTLAFQAICRLAHERPDQRVLVIDVCPQANLSELMLGSLQNDGGGKLLQIQGGNVRSTVGGYFETRLPSPYQVPAIDPIDYITNPNQHNRLVPTNIDLLAGDAILELQANTMYSQANLPNPLANSWFSVISWLDDFLHSAPSYDYVFFDLNPSFSLYTQIALAASDRVILPVMADDSSRRAIQNAFSLIYGLSLPSPIYAQHSFSTQLQNSGGSLPRTHLIIKNRLTQYMGPASGYAAVLKSIDRDVERLINSNGSIFSFTEQSSAFAEVRDFQTCGVVAAARGAPFFTMTAKRYDVFGQRIQVNRDQIDLANDHVMRIVNNF